MKRIVLLATHVFAMLFGFALGIYLLPILTAPASPAMAALETAIGPPVYTTAFSKALPGSDFLHWGEGKVHIGAQGIALTGSLAPGPDYRLYLVPGKVERKADFLPLKDRSLHVGHIRTFDNFIVPFDDAVDIDQYQSVVVWCESFSMFITAAQYR